VTGPEREPTDAELEALLRRLGPERPDPLRFEEARLAFLRAGEGRSRPEGADRTSSVMTRGLSSDEPDAFADWLAARPLADRPRPEAVRRARLAFLSALATENAVPTRARRPVRALVLLAAAAAMLLVTFLPRAPRWAVQMTGPVRFEEREYAPGDEARLAADLERSGRLESLGSVLRVSLGSALDLELRAGGVLAMPPLPELDGVSGVAFGLELGETYLRTAPSYPGNPIRVQTDYGDVLLHGTTVGVLVDDAGVCLCVADGRARLQAPGLPGGQGEVAAGQSLRVWSQPDRMAKVEPFPEDGAGAEGVHTRELQDFLAEF